MERAYGLVTWRRSVLDRQGAGDLRGAVDPSGVAHATWREDGARGAVRACGLDTLAGSLFDRRGGRGVEWARDARELATRPAATRTRVDSVRSRARYPTGGEGMLRDRVTDDGVECFT